MDPCATGGCEGPRCVWEGGVAERVADLCQEGDGQVFARPRLQGHKEMVFRAYASGRFHWMSSIPIEKTFSFPYARNCRKHLPPVMFLQ